MRPVFLASTVCLFCLLLSPPSQANYQAYAAYPAYDGYSGYPAAAPGNPNYGGYPSPAGARGYEDYGTYRSAPPPYPHYGNYPSAPTAPSPADYDYGSYPSAPAYGSYSGYRNNYGTKSAEGAAIRDMNTAIWASAGAAFLNYKEPIWPIADSQRGWLPSFDLGIGFMSRKNLYLALEASVATGDDTYRGALYDEEDGFYDIPFQYQTHATFFEIDGKLGKGFTVDKNVMITPYVDLGFRWWERDMGDDFVEDYQNFSALGGAMLQAAITQRFLLTTYVQAGVTFAAEMSDPDFEFDLGSGFIYKTGLKLDYRVTPLVDLFGTVDFQHFRFGESDVIDGYFEPESSTNETTLRLGVAYRLR